MDSPGKYDFNPLPRKEGDNRDIATVFLGVNFNPLPRKEGDAKAIGSETAAAISIHSLVKRETNALSNKIKLYRYFNPLPRKEGDCFAVRFADTKQVNFNPLPRKEGDMSFGGKGYVPPRFQSTPS